MVSKTKVLNQAFSTAQAICPVNASATITNQMRGVIPRVDEFCIGFPFPSDENNLFYQRSRKYIFASESEKTLPFFRTPSSRFTP
jgi:hypothetical protein